MFIILCCLYLWKIMCCCHVNNVSNVITVIVYIFFQVYSSICHLFSTLNCPCRLLLDVKYFWRNICFIIFINYMVDGSNIVYLMLISIYNLLSTVKRCFRLLLLICIFYYLDIVLFKTTFTLILFHNFTFFTLFTNFIYHHFFFEIYFFNYCYNFISKQKTTSFTLSTFLNTMQTLLLLFQINLIK